MEKTKNKGNIIAAVIAVSVIAFFALVLIIPASREVFKSLSSSHPYIMGFLKFGLLASCGEIFALRIKRKSWAFPNYFHFRVLIWGAIGIAITFMMKVYTYGDLRAQGVKKPGLKRTIETVNWHGFVSFTLLKTIPLFWIPAHTVTFMLPAEYQVIMAAALSIALGIMLSLKKN